MSDSVAEFCASPVTITLAGKEWAFHPLEITDWADGEGWLKGYDITKFLESTRHMDGVALPESLRAATLAAISTKQYCYNDVIASQHSRIYMLWKSAAKGDPKMTYRQFEANPPAMKVSTLTDIVLKVSGEDEPAKEDGDRPLSESVSTTTTTPSNVDTPASETT